jgi:hypothetical protein
MPSKDTPDNRDDHCICPQCRKLADATDIDLFNEEIILHAEVQHVEEDEGDRHDNSADDTKLA